MMEDIKRSPHPLSKSPARRDFHDAAYKMTESLLVDTSTKAALTKPPDSFALLSR